MILKYIKENWDELPKSAFDDETVVIFHCIRDENYGWGHHTYEGYGGDINGNLVWCYSSGCSCNGTVQTEHKCTEKELKTFTIDGLDLSKYNPSEINFSGLEVTFSTY